MSSYTSTMLKLERMTQSTNAQQMAWQEKMSGQSHQLEVSDLVKAGLNPVLSAGGNGAQSYTTSLDSGANAIANTYSAHESAAATRYAARQSAAATRAAAYANLEAARLGYNASIYGSDKNLEAQKYSADMSYKTQIDKPVTNLAGFLDKMANKSNLYELTNTNTVKGLNRAAKLLLNDPGAYFKEVGQGTINVKNFVLSSKGIKVVKNVLSAMGIGYSYKIARDFVKGTVFGDQNAYMRVISKIPTRRSYNSSRNVMTRNFY